MSAGGGTEKNNEPGGGGGSLAGVVVGCPLENSSRNPGNVQHFSPSERPYTADRMERGLWAHSGQQEKDMRDQLGVVLAGTVIAAALVFVHISERQEARCEFLMTSLNDINGGILVNMYVRGGYGGATEEIKESLLNLEDMSGTSLQKCVSR